MERNEIGEVEMRILILVSIVRPLFCIRNIFNLCIWDEKFTKWKLYSNRIVPTRVNYYNVEFGLFNLEHR